MARYIDADELLRKSIRIEGHFNLPSGKAQNFSAIDEAIILNFPTADVAPVVHGCWVKEKPDVLVYWKCSACCNCYYLDEPNAKYCPNCGAKMDGENPK